jgi:hypothetical protein
MDGMNLHRRRRLMQYILVGCALALVFGLDYYLLLNAIQR